MAKLERSYNVPLRRGYVNTPRYKRAKKATTVLREFIQKHMKSEDVKIGQHLNHHIWKHGIKNPPHHVKVKAVKDDEGLVKVELEGFDFKETIKAAEAEAEEGGLASKLTGALGGKTSKKEAVPEPPKEEVKETPKKDKPKIEKKTAEKKEAKPTKKIPAKKAKK